MESLLVGFDVGCRRHRVAVDMPDGRLLDQFDVDHQPTAFKHFLHELRSRLQSTDSIFQSINASEIHRPVFYFMWLLNLVQRLYRTMQSEPFAFVPMCQDRIVFQLSHPTV